MCVCVCVCVCVCACACVCACVAVNVKHLQVSLVEIINLLHVCRMLLTRYLAETGENSDIAGIIAISALWDAPVSGDGLERFPNRQFYNWYLARKLRRMVHRLAKSLLALFLCHLNFL